MSEEIEISHIEKAIPLSERRFEAHFGDEINSFKAALVEVLDAAGEELSAETIEKLAVRMLGEIDRRVTIMRGMEHPADALIRERGTNV